MANVINGTFTVKEVLGFTNAKMKSRFKNAKRDKVKFIKITKIRYYNPDRPGEPIVKYDIKTQSTPQYQPYAKAKDKRGRYRQSQRSIRHEYDCILQMDRLSLNTKNWKMVIGKIVKLKDPPQNKIGQIFKKTREQWKKRYKTKEAYDKQVRKHKKQAKYISVGDWQSQVLKINQDFYFRCIYIWKKYNHLYELGGYKGSLALSKPPKVVNKKQIMFFPKHAIVLIESLMKAGILKDD